MLRSIENNAVKGMVYADDEDEPSTCVVRIGHLLFFGGSITGECLVYVKAKILTFEIYEKYGLFYFYYPNEAWRNALMILFPEQCEVRERSLHGIKSMPIAQIQIPPFIVPITPKLMESGIKNREMIINEVGNTDLFLKNGIGYAVLIDGGIQGFCTSEYKSDKELAIGIEVVQAHQKKGYAKAMTSAFLKDAMGKGFNVYWESWKSNTASVNTALSCGFRHIADYPMIFLDLRELNRSGRAPDENDVLLAARKHLPETETVMRVPKGLSTYVY